MKPEINPKYMGVEIKDITPNEYKRMNLLIRKAFPDILVFENYLYRPFEGQLAIKKVTGPIVPILLIHPEEMAIHLHENTNSSRVVITKSNTTSEYKSVVINPGDYIFSPFEADDGLTTYPWYFHLSNYSKPDGTGNSSGLAKGPVFSPAGNILCEHIRFTYPWDISRKIKYMLAFVGLTGENQLGRFDVGFVINQNR